MTIVETDAENARIIVESLVSLGEDVTSADFGELVRQFPKSHGEMWTKPEILSFVDTDFGDAELPALRRLLTKKPIRSLSGITSITVLTKPFPCPGRCVFCPVDVRMPKSYIASEPGAQRAGRLGFDPYQQVTARLNSYSQSGHPISKIELIVLGGSWSAYDREYQIWFIKRLFDALNDFGHNADEDQSAYPTDWEDRISAGETYNAHVNASQYVLEPYEETATQEELQMAQMLNETANSRCVGMSLETRPDLIDVEECINLRKLGATKIQIGIQNLNDEVLKLNKRGHSVAQTREAISLLRKFGFKIHAHWMPNLYGATPEGDIEDYQRLFDDPAIRPDELKVYPTVLIENTELEGLANAGAWNAYSEEDLNRILSFVLTNTPEYCRLTRIIRDIPSFEILAGNKKGNLRQIVEQGVAKSEMRDIRAREIKDEQLAADDLKLDMIQFDTAETSEVFFQYIRPTDRKIAGFLRLSLPKQRETHPWPELANCAVIREVHVYGQALNVGAQKDAAQHKGLGTRLIEAACQTSLNNGFTELAVISSVGTRKYYDKLGFTRGSMYQIRPLVS